MEKELGSAGVYADLSNGVITVRHCEGKSILAQWNAKKGDWNIIWKIIRHLEEVSDEWLPKTRMAT